MGLLWLGLWIYIAYVMVKFMKRGKGWLGEKVVAARLSELPKEHYIILNNILLQTERGTSQIDHLVFSIYGIFVIETKNYQGWIYGKEKQSYWTQNIYGKKTQFKNPLHQNYGHIQAVKACLAENDLPFISIVVFSNEARLKTKMEAHVIQFRDIRRVILSYSNYCLSKADIQRMAHQILTHNLSSKENQMQHVAQVQNKKRENETLIQTGICPQCKGKLVERHGKYGKFIGCSHYPKCKYTRENIRK